MAVRKAWLSMYGKDFQKGDTYITKGRTLTEGDLLWFSAFTGDTNPLHTDEVYSRATAFGGRIAHGLLVLSVAYGLLIRTGIFDDCAQGFLGIHDWKFLAPVRIGDTIHTEAVIKDIRQSRKNHQRGIVTISLRVLNQAGVLCQTGEAANYVAWSPDAADEGK